MDIETAMEQLERSHREGRLAHGYVIEGSPRGSAGELARRLMLLLFCTAVEKPCGKCRACLGVNKGTHPDVFIVSSQKKSRQIDVEQMRNVEASLNYTSFAGGWKVCVIYSADRLNRAASNAFLKTLEEPPGQTLMLLLTDSPQQLLPTILSRCQRIVLSGDDTRLAAPIQEALLSILGEGGDGGFRALSRAGALEQMLKQIKKETAATVKEQRKTLEIEEDEDTLDALIESTYREIRTDVFRFMTTWYRDMLHIVAGSSAHLVHGGQERVLRERAAGLGLGVVQRNLRTVDELHRRVEQNLPEGVALGEAFLSLA